MRNKSSAGVTYVAEAHKRALQLRRALIALLQTVEEKDAAWNDLAYDADCMERRLWGALQAMNKVLVQNPNAYTPPPRSD
jgi:hypothetical protein